LSRSWHIPVEDDEKDDEKYDEKYHEYEDYGDYRQRGQRQPKAKKQSTDLIPGIVIRALGHHFEVQTFPDDDPSCTSGIRLCQARGRLLQEKGQTTLVAVGDRVRLRPKADDTGQIEGSGIGGLCHCPARTPSTNVGPLLGHCRGQRTACHHLYQ